MRFPALLTALLMLGLVMSSAPISAADPIAISGHVTMADGSDPVAVTITIDDGVTPLEIHPDSAGDYSVPSLSPGSYEVSASLLHYSANTTYTVDVTASGLDFTLTPLPGTLTGFVSDGTVSVPGATVGLMGEDEDYTTFSNGPAGDYNFQNIAPGVYTPYAEKDGYKVNFSSPLTITSGSAYVLNFTLQSVAANTANITGKVTSEKGALSGVTVTLTSSDDKEATTATDANGAYSFTNIAPGEYTLMFTKDGYVGASKPILVQSQSDRVDDIVLEQESLPGTSGFLFGYDLSHSLMILGLGLALITLLSALVFRYRVGKKPELLSQEEEEKKE